MHPRKNGSYNYKLKTDTHIKSILEVINPSAVNKIDGTELIQDMNSH